MKRPFIDTAQNCLELVTIKWQGPLGMEKSEIATLLEIARRGGMLHVDEVIPPGTAVQLELRNGQRYDAQVESYEQDEFGVYAKVSTSAQWFPEQFSPEFLITPRATTPSYTPPASGPAVPLPTVA